MSVKLKRTKNKNIMDREQLFEQIKKKKSFLCVGLDSDIDKIPKKLKVYQQPQFAFNKEIIDATAKYTVAYKLNLAFYESRGWKGMQELELTVAYIRDRYPEMFIIADVKKGDIGDTAIHQAKAYFETTPFDAVTVAPYMGEDSVNPFLSYDDKWIIMLALTSNNTKTDFQFKRTVLEKTGQPGYHLYADVVATSRDWEKTNEDNLMYVVGATNASHEVKFIRRLVPNNFFLVPGVGAQGGSLREVAKYGMNDKCGLLVNSSRGIIFAGIGIGVDESNFATHAASAAYEMQQEMEFLLKEKISIWFSNFLKSQGICPGFFSILNFFISSSCLI